MSKEREKKDLVVRTMQHTHENILFLLFFFVTCWSFCGSLSVCCVPGGCALCVLCAVSGEDAMIVLLFNFIVNAD